MARIPVSRQQMIAIAVSLENTLDLIRANELVPWPLRVLASEAAGKALWLKMNAEHMEDDP